MLFRSGDWKSWLIFLGDDEDQSTHMADADKIAQKVRVNNPNFNIEIGGHTDNTGDKKSNQILSENRSKAVYNYLTGKGVSPSRLSFKGFGDTLPIDSNDTDVGRSQNRRTDFKIKSL